MNKFIYLFCICTVMLGCHSEKKNQGESVLTVTGENKMFLATRSDLWGISNTRMAIDSVTGTSEYREVMTEPDVWFLRVAFRYTQLYVEPGDVLEVKFQEGKFCFGGDASFVSRQELLEALHKEREVLADYRRRLLFAERKGEEYKGEVVDAKSVYATCDSLIAAFKREGKGCSESFGRFLDIDNKYYKISTQVTLPPYKNKTYHNFTPEDLFLLKETTRDAGLKEATLSLYYRQMARAYMDYLRIEDPEHKMGPGEDYLQNELRLGNYFGEGEVADMLRAFNLDMIGYQHAGDSMYRKAVECLPMKWQTGLTDYFTPRTEVKGRKISVAVDYPEIEGETPEGKRVSLKDFAGKWVFVDCWDTWCGPCNFEIPFLGHLEHALEGENIVFLGISVDVEKDREKWKAFIQEKGLGGIQILCKDKQELYNQFGISGIPHFALIDPTGRLVMNKMPHPSTGVPHHLLKAMVK